MRSKSFTEPCETFELACREISQEADLLRSTNKFYDERCAVSRLLLLLESRCPDRVKTWQRGLNEPKSGADLEMWFVAHDRWVGFRLQAKLHQGNNDNFGHLDHPDGTGRQVDNLISATPKGLIPLHLFFSGANAAGKCSGSCDCPAPNHYWAIAVADSLEVQHLVRQGTMDARNVRSILKPLICTFCCESGGDVVERALAFSQVVAGRVPQVRRKPPRNALEVIRYGRPLRDEAQVGASAVLVVGQGEEDVHARPEL